MKEPIVSLEAKEARPFAIKRAIVGLELGSADFTLLKYLDFLSHQFPVDALHFINVIKEVELLNAFYEQNIQALSSRLSIDESLIQQMEQKVKSVLSKEKEIVTDFEINEGDPLDQLLATVEATKAGLLILGQRSGDDYHGILTKNLVRQVKVDTLIVPESAEPRISSILVPVDFSDFSVRALKTAISIATQLGDPVRITCLNVFEMPSIAFYKVDKSYEHFCEIIKKNIMDAFEAFLNTHAKEHRALIDIKLIEKQMPGAGKYVHDFARENGHDLIVMGLKGHSNLHLLLMGSTTEKVLSLNKNIPMLLIK